MVGVGEVSSQCRTCARRHYCILYGKVKGKCPFWIPDPYKLWAEKLDPRWGQRQVPDWRKEAQRRYGRCGGGP